MQALFAIVAASIDPTKRTAVPRIIKRPRTCDGLDPQTAGLPGMRLPPRWFFFCSRRPTIVTLRPYPRTVGSKQPYDPRFSTQVPQPLTDNPIEIPPLSRNATQLHNRKPRPPSMPRIICHKKRTKEPTKKDLASQDPRFVRALRCDTKSTGQMSWARCVFFLILVLEPTTARNVHPIKLRCIQHFWPPLAKYTMFTASQSTSLSGLVVVADELWRSAGPIHTLIVRSRCKAAQATRFRPS